MSKSKDNISKFISGSVFLAIAGMLITVGMSKEKNDSHIANEYIHQDTKALDETYVRKDVFIITLTGIADDIKDIKGEMGIK